MNIHYRFYTRIGVMLWALLAWSCEPTKSTGEEDATEASETTSNPLTAHDQQIDSLIAEMSLAEKIDMIHASSSFTSGGVERLGIPELTMSDGPHGVRPEHGRDWELDNEGIDSATYLPTGIALASTWNPALGYAFGEVLGSEANARGKDVILGPGINIMRTPLNGRNFEYLSEDPYLISKMVVGYIEGVQDQGVAACVKHYIANNQEINRFTINVEMDERTLREIYLPGFEAAVKEANVYTLMGAYNQFRGQYATHNEYLINDVLKDEWGFKGLVVSDWGAVHNVEQALKYGTDIEMGTDIAQLPNVDYSKFLMADTALQLVENGTIDEKLIDDKVRRILRVMYATEMFGDRQEGAFSTKAHQQTAGKIAEEAIVLLKNDDLLPLSKDIKSVAVIGANATWKQSMGGGSSQVLPPYEITPLEGIKNLVGDAVEVTYAAGFEIKEDESANPALIAEAIDAAKAADYVIYVGGWTHGHGAEWNQGRYDMESVDKPDMHMPYFQEELLQAVLKANANTAVVLMGGGPVDMTSWIAQTPAIVQAWYPGMEGGNALARILFGEVNPSGKLPVTFPKKLSESAAHVMGEYPGNADTTSVTYNEGVFIGYRYNDTYNVEPQFSFGHGLSYTSFAYSDLKLTKEGNTVKGTFTLKNTGDRAGAEVVQVYVHDSESSVKRPEKELKAFEKVKLEAGASTEVSFTLSDDAFKYYDTDKKSWVLEPGTFEIRVGASASDIKLMANTSL